MFQTFHELTTTWSTLWPKKDAGIAFHEMSRVGRVSSSYGRKVAMVSVGNREVSWTLKNYVGKC